jgi:hypothetical protein
LDSDLDSAAAGAADSSFLGSSFLGSSAAGAGSPPEMSETEKFSKAAISSSLSTKTAMGYVKKKVEIILDRLLSILPIPRVHKKKIFIKPRFSHFSCIVFINLPDRQQHP